MDLYQALESRHTVRHFTDQPVDTAVIERLIAAAALAPSASNLQPWRLHVCTGATREAFVEVMSMSTLHLVEYLGITDPVRIEEYERFFGNLGNADVVIAMSLPPAADELQRINQYVSAGCALENLLLTAVAEGLGAGNMTSSFWVRERLASILGLGEDREVVCVVLVGHPAEEPLAPKHRMDIATFHA